MILTDQSVRTMVAEIVREKILQTTEEEIPYVTAVVVEKWEEEREGLHAHSLRHLCRTRFAEEDCHRQRRRTLERDRHRRAAGY
jgi:hypothetical protein